jgi:hypothetical protein
MTRFRVNAAAQLLPGDEAGLTFLGLVAMHDPPRPECARALDMSRQVRVRVLCRRVCVSACAVYAHIRVSLWACVD